LRQYKRLLRARLPARLWNLRSCLVVFFEDFFKALFVDTCAVVHAEPLTVFFLVTGAVIYAKQLTVFVVTGTVIYAEQLTVFFVVTSAVVYAKQLTVREPECCDHFGWLCRWDRRRYLL
jgi:hypothetical protein